MCVRERVCVRERERERERERNREREREHGTLDAPPAKGAAVCALPQH